MTQSSEAKDELRITEEVLTQEDANAALTKVNRKMIAQRDDAIQARLRVEKLHHRASILATTTLEEMLTFSSSTDHPGHRSIRIRRRQPPRRSRTKLILP